LHVRKLKQSNSQKKTRGRQARETKDKRKKVWEMLHRRLEDGGGALWRWVRRGEETF
jgi:hypothetical protein